MPPASSSEVKRSRSQASQYQCHLTVLDQMNMHTKNEGYKLYRLKNKGEFLSFWTDTNENGRPKTLEHKSYGQVQTSTGYCLQTSKTCKYKFNKLKIYYIYLVSDPNFSLFYLQTSYRFSKSK